MHISVRPASLEDLPRLTALYPLAEEEQTARKPVWALTDGLDRPLRDALSSAISDPESWFLVGEIDGVVVGFIWATVESMLDRAAGRQIGTIRLIYTEPDARGVGVGHHMLEAVLRPMRELGIGDFDARVGPGQRLTKNFFEGHEFAARSIVMHHSDTGNAGDD
ncbi:MAG: GNAT family N-acetyltransferase [Acidimicrobiia bacterium]